MIVNFLGRTFTLCPSATLAPVPRSKRSYKAKTSTLWKWLWHWCQSHRSRGKCGKKSALPMLITRTLNFISLRYPLKMIFCHASAVYPLLERQFSSLAQIKFRNGTSCRKIDDCSSSKSGTKSGKPNNWARVAWIPLYRIKTKTDFLKISGICVFCKKTCPTAVRKCRNTTNYVDLLFHYTGLNVSNT